MFRVSPETHRKAALAAELSGKGLSKWAEVLDPVAQHLNGAALGDLALQPGQERPPRRPVVGQRQRLGGLRLGATQEGRELHHIDAVLAVVVMEVAAAPPRSTVSGRRIARMPGQSRADQPFQPAFRGVRSHIIPPEWAPQ